MGKADLHLHTSYSDGQPSVVELLDHIAARTDLTVIAITDHDTIAGAEVAQALARREGYPFEVIVGEEVSTRDGHIVGLFLERAVPPHLSAAEAVAAIHAQGGLAFAPHPFFNDRPWRDRRPMDGVGKVLERLPVDAIEVDNSTPFLERANWRARRYARRRGLPALGASDAHIALASGKSFTNFPGRGADDLRRAILAGTVKPGALAYTLPELLAYLRFWRGYGRTPAGTALDPDPISHAASAPRTLGGAREREAEAALLDLTHPRLAGVPACGPDTSSPQGRGS